MFFYYPGQQRRYRGVSRALGTIYIYIYIHAGRWREKCPYEKKKQIARKCTIQSLLALICHNNQLMNEPIMIMQVWTSSAEEVKHPTKDLLP